MLNLRNRSIRKGALACGRVLLFWLGTMALLAISGPIAGTGRQAALVIGALTAPATLALTALFIKWEGKRFSDYCFEIGRGSLFRFAGGILFGFLLVGAQTALMLIGGGVHWVAAVPAPTIIFPILGYLLLAAREELAFRGYPLRKLASQFGPWSAQIVVAALFIVEHRLAGSSWINALIGSGMGALVFSMAALASRGLALPIGLHAAWNIGDWARGTKGAKGLWNIVIEPASAIHAQRIAMASYVGVMLLALAVFWQWYLRSRCPMQTSLVANAIDY